MEYIHDLIILKLFLSSYTLRHVNKVLPLCMTFHFLEQQTKTIKSLNQLIKISIRHICYIMYFYSLSQHCIRYRTDYILIKSVISSIFVLNTRSPLNQLIKIYLHQRTPSIRHLKFGQLMLVAVFFNFSLPYNIPEFFMFVVTPHITYI